MLSTFIVIAAGAACLLSATNAQKGFNPAYYADPWTDVCATGMMQTPIDIPADYAALPSVPDELVTSINMPVAMDAVVKNVGNAVQITWDAAQFVDADDAHFPTVAAGGHMISDALLVEGTEADVRLKMIPLQVHWHVPSEHSWDGMMGASELHIVTAVGPGEAPKEWGCDAVWAGGDPVLEKCIAVFGVMFRVTEGPSPEYYKPLIESFPHTVEAETPYPGGSFDLAALLPEDKSYYTYIGSLTTPPCAEGLRWHVFNEQVMLNYADVILLESKLANSTSVDTGERQMYRHNNRPVQPLNGRTIWFHDDGEARIPGVAGTIKATH